MPKSKRLPRAEFQARGYAAMRTPMFSLKTKSNEGKGLRIGIVIGKSVEKTAVKRNFWKRQARSVFQALPGGDHDVMLVVYPGVRTATRKQFRDALARSMKQAVR